MKLFLHNGLNENQNNNDNNYFITFKTENRVVELRRRRPTTRLSYWTFLEFQYRSYTLGKYNLFYKSNFFNY